MEEADRQKVTPGEGFDHLAVLNDAAGSPFAVGIDDGQVAIQVAPTSPRGIIRLGPGQAAEVARILADADEIALILTEAAARRQAATRPEPPPPPGDTR